MATDTIFNVGKAIVGGVMLDDHISKFLETAYVIVLAKESATFQNRRILDILKPISYSSRIGSKCTCGAKVHVGVLEEGWYRRADCKVFELGPWTT